MCNNILYNKYYCRLLYQKNRFNEATTQKMNIFNKDLKEINILNFN